MDASGKKRIVFLDYLRVIACFLVLLTHANEPVYLGGQGTAIESAGDAFWSTFFVTLARCCVPLFVLASSYLLFPVSGRGTGEFLKRRFTRVGIPALVWLVLYALIGGGTISDNFIRLPFNFPAPAGHLWFCYMIIGLYLLMPLLSPWAEKVSKRELVRWIGLWGVTTLIPPVRQAAMFLSGSLGDLSGWGVWGEANWSEFGTFYYVSGFVGYLLIGLYFRKFAGVISWKRTLAAAIPMFAAGAVLAGAWFYGTMPKEFPFNRPIKCAVVMETMLRYCTLSVALMTVAVFICIRKIGEGNSEKDAAQAWGYRHIILPLSGASYGIYLCHILLLVPLYGFWRGLFGSGATSLWTTPCTVVCTAISTFFLAALVSLLLGRIPKVGKYIVG